MECEREPGPLNSSVTKQIEHLSVMAIVISNQPEQNRELAETQMEAMLVKPWETNHMSPSEGIQVGLDPGQCSAEGYFSCTGLVF